MLVATRDPVLHPGAHDASPRHDAAAGMPAGAAVPRVARFMTVLQMVGSLLAIPIGLASGYSIYRANFSVDTTCQTLRANIVSMIDKKIDATTRRMLVRHDVETFEKSCGGVDPDAEAAFKALLAADKTPAPAVAAAAPRAAAPPKEVARKAEPHPAVAAKRPTAHAAPVTVEAKPVRRAASVSDVRWLAAVRHALVTHAPERAPSAETAAAATVAPAAVQPVMPETRVVSRAPAPAMPLTQPAPVASFAPVLPPATSVATAPARQADADHPVPPASIPEITSVPAEVTGATAEQRPGSRFGWIAQIPLLGQVFGSTDAQPR
jgi:hypothetical protein